MQYFPDEPFITMIAGQPLEDSFGGALRPACQRTETMLRVADTRPYQPCLGAHHRARQRHLVAVVTACVRPKRGGPAVGTSDAT